MQVIDGDSGLSFEVLEVLDDGGLLVRGAGAPFTIRPPCPEAVSLTFDEGDPLTLVRAAQALGYDPLPDFL